MGTVGANRDEDYDLLHLDILEELQVYIDYYATRRGVGHSLAIWLGVANRPETIMIVDSRSQAIAASGPRPLILPRAEAISRLPENSAALVFDNRALMSIFIEANNEIAKLRTSLALARTVKNPLDNFKD